MQKVLILGSSGMAGHVMYQYLHSLNKYELFDISKSCLNERTILLEIKGEQEISEIICKIKPDVVINCVGVLIENSKKNIANAVLINSYLPHFLSNLIHNIGGKLIHISTDCVFTGKKGNYKYDDIADAEDIYGKSKSLGEIVNNIDLTIRTSIIGPELKDGEGLFHWFINQQKRIDGYTEVFWSGITTLELAKFVNFSIDNKISGLVQLTNGIKISKYELLMLINTIFKKNIIIVPQNYKKADKSLLENCTKLNYCVPSYSEMLLELYGFMLSSKNLYSKKYILTEE